MMNISIVGTGRVAFHLLHALYDKATIIQVIGRNKNALTQLHNKFQVSIISDYALIKPAELYILCISDDAIELVAKNLTPFLSKDAVLAHTSGTKSLAVFENIWQNTGIFYPLQSFTKESKIDFKHIPILISSASEQISTSLKTLAMTISKTVYDILDNDRKRIHLAAVVVNNHINHLIHLTKSYCEDHSLDFDMLRPLLEETVRKIETLDPIKAQTGPAMRGDESTINNHVELLEEYPLFQEIYQTITDSITLTYHS